MKRRGWLPPVLAVAIIGIAALVAVAAPAPGSSGKTVASLGMFKAAKWSVHYVVPRDGQVVSLLEKAGIPMSTPAAREQAVAQFREEWAQRNPTTPNPKKLSQLMRAERKGRVSADPSPDIKILAVPVEFTGTDTFDAYDGDGNPITATTTGPLHNEIPAPGPRDNNTLWYDDATASLYEELYFGVGKDAGVVVHHPNLGTVDLKGLTMANYYLEQSEGKFVPEGTVYPKWLQVAHSEGWYGADNQSGSNHNVRAWDLVRDTVDAINADDASFPWQDYDADGNGIVDNFTVIHAGMGQEGGGGQQGNFAIWSHASAVDYPQGYLACAAGTHGATRDIYVREYSMDPENLDVGVISEEFGHAAFGLPDIYVGDGQASPCNWTIMESGSWNGILGGAQPAPFPLYFRYIVGWAKPVEVDYRGAVTAKVGQLSLRPKGTKSGIKVDLPDEVVTTGNPAGTGQAWWSQRGDLADWYLAHDFDLSTASAPVFSFASAWSFEADYDYGYVEVSTDGGTTWTKLADMDGVFVDDGMGNLGLNGEASGTLRFDLTAYAGQQVSLRLHYTSDMGVQWAGWFADDFLLADGASTLFSDDVENPPNGWTTDNFVIVPKTDVYPRYYLAEWRNDSGFDKGLKYPYTTIYSNDATTEWEVDRGPYTVPGMLLWLRNSAQDWDYTLGDSLQDPPSYGPKHALLVVDSHYWPLEWEGMGTTGAHLRLNARLQPGNATFTVQPTTGYTVRRADADWNVVETKTFSPLPAVSQFHDSLGYYPGLRYNPDDGYLYFWDWQASLVVPAKGSYTTRITNNDKSAATDLYGYDMGDTVLGSGDPRDDGVQFGVNLAVLGKAKNGSYGTIAFWNAKSLGTVRMSASPTTARAGAIVTYTITVTNTTPAWQPYVLTDAVPAGATWVKGGAYDSAAGVTTWSTSVKAGKSKVFVLKLRLDADLLADSTVTNIVELADDANGDSAVKTVLVK